MENIILGLLMLQSMTIYELNAAFRRGLILIYSASYGNLQYAVKNLLKKDMISFDARVDNGRNKKIYTINKKGIAAFNSWMSEETTSHNIETTMLSKIYFLGLINGEPEKKKILNNLRASANEYLQQLETVKKEIDAIDLPESAMGIAKYQLSTINYGISVSKVALEYVNDVDTL